MHVNANEQMDEQLSIKGQHNTSVDAFTMAVGFLTTVLPVIILPIITVCIYRL